MLTPPAPTSPRILCVDPLEEDLLVLEKILPNYNVVKVTSGSAALEFLVTHEVAVIFLNVEMPGGFDIARRLLERAKPLFFLATGDSFANCKTQAYQLGATDVLLKPLNADEVLVKITRIIGNATSESKLVDTQNQRFLEVPGEMAQRFRSFDWSHHLLGSIESWDQSLVTAVGILLRSAFPQFILWGPERTILYNDAYRPILGSQKHPQAFGARFEDVWQEVLTDLGPILEGGDRGESCYFEDRLLYLNRNGFLEQAYFTFSYSPILNDQGRVGGLICCCVETTKRKLLERERQVQTERLETVISTMTEGVVFFSPTGELLRMNDEALRQHGFNSYADMTKQLDHFRSFLALESPKGRPVDFKDWPASRALRGERFTDYQVHLTDSRSGRKWIGSYGGAPIYDETGKMAFAVLTIRDVTDQVQAELNLRESERRLQQTIETIPQGIWRTTPAGAADYFSERFCANTGYKAEDLLGWGWSRIIHLEDRERVLSEWARCRKLKQPVSVSFRVIKSDGACRWFLALANPLFNEQGVLTQYYGTWADVHDEKMAQTELLLKSDALENSLNGFDIIDAKGEFIYANRAYLKMWGYDSLDEILGTSPVAHCADPEVPKRIIKALKAQGECNIEFKALRKDGSTFDVIMWARLAYDTDGNEIYPTTSIDVTERRRAIKALKRQSDLTKTITDNAASCLFMMDKQGRPTFMNPAAEKLTGYNLQDIKDRPLHYAIHYKKPDGSHYPLEECPIDNAQVHLKQIRNQEELFVDRAGKLYPVSYSVSPLQNNGKMIGSVLEFRDVSAQKAIEAELRWAKEEAERANELKSAFLANMSHEIRTPLGAMIGFADLLRDPHLSLTEHSNYVDILIRNGEQLAVIINDILDLSKVEAGHLALELTDTDARAIAGDVISLLHVKASEKGLELSYSREETTPEMIISDPTRLRQILLNLVGNAIKFTQTGSVRLRSYGLKSLQGRDQIAFEIEDTGIGIPQGQQERIFEVFVQADGSMTRRFGGTGLGLALSRRLARALGGDISVARTKEGQGTVMKLVIEDQVSKSEGAAFFSNEQRPEISIGQTALEGLRVLVVDDAPDNQMLIRRYLTQRGAAVDSAENGLEGYHKALGGNHDIVLMDIQMPIMDGYTATQKLRAAGYLKPIIALTAHAMTEVRMKCLNVGCTDHLPKPINSKELIQAVVRHTSKQH